MHPQDRDRLWGSHDAYKVQNPDFVTSSANLRRTAQYQELHRAQKEKVKADKEWAEWQRAPAEAPAEQPPQEWWTAERWPEEGAWKKRRW